MIELDVRGHDSSLSTPSNDMMLRRLVCFSLRQFLCRHAILCLRGTHTVCSCAGVVPGPWTAFLPQSHRQQSQSVHYEFPCACTWHVALAKVAGRT